MHRAAYPLPLEYLLYVPDARFAHIPFLPSAQALRRSKQRPYKIKAVQDIKDTAKNHNQGNVVGWYTLSLCALEHQLPLLLAKRCGSQHLLAMLTWLTTTPIIFASSFNLDNGTSVYMVSASFIGSGASSSSNYLPVNLLTTTEPIPTPAPLESRLQSDTSSPPIPIPSRFTRDIPKHCYSHPIHAIHRFLSTFGMNYLIYLIDQGAVDRKKLDTDVSFAASVSEMERKLLQNIKRCIIVVLPYLWIS
ncbi:hypothetical protein F5887DRAFT_915412 [Amanita rubescens]|nr:hypothetical protein F5887DRAFT_924183 [Amanita rubescens]KAF8347654.1 hypothetical protein F5887DRAFT_915412 [Amanita rubescens]